MTSTCFLVKLLHQSALRLLYSQRLKDLSSSFTYLARYTNDGAAIPVPLTWLWVCHSRFHRDNKAIKAMKHAYAVTPRWGGSEKIMSKPDMPMIFTGKGTSWIVRGQTSMFLQQPHTLDWKSCFCSFIMILGSHRNNFATFL